MINIKYNTVLGLVVVVQQNSSLALLLRNIQLTEENSLPGIFMTLIVCMPDLKLFFGFRFISINTVYEFLLFALTVGQILCDGGSLLLL